MQTYTQKIKLSSTGTLELTKPFSDAENLLQFMSKGLLLACGVLYSDRFAAGSSRR